MRVRLIPLVLVSLAGCATTPKSGPVDDPWAQTLRLARAEEARPSTSLTPLTTALAVFDAPAEAFLEEGKPLQPMSPGVQVFVTWYRTGAGFGNDPCLAPLTDRTPELLQLGRYALLTAETIEDPQVAATLALADGLRKYGGLLQGLLGAQLFADTVRWASTRGLEGRALLSAHVPQTAEFVEISAREWVCSILQIERLLQEPDRSTTISELAQMNNLSAESLASTIDADLERFRTAVARQIVQMAEHPDDPEWIAKHTDFRLLKAQAGPFAVLLNDTTLPFRSFEDAQATWAEYDRRRPRKFRPPAIPRRPDPTGPWVPASVQRISEDRFTISADDLAATLDDLAPLALQARIVPAFVDGTVVGFKLFAIRRGGAFDVLGLENGDLIERINGIALTSAEAAIAAGDRIRQLGKVVFEVRRGDFRFERYIDVVENR